MDIINSLTNKFRKYKEDHGIAVDNTDETYEKDVDDIDDDEWDDLYDDIITTADWRKTHIADVSCPSDTYYAEAAEDLRFSLFPLIDRERFSTDFVRNLAIALVAYVEDIKSELGAWDAFRNLYKAKYGHWLPFYDTDHDDYFTDDLNVEDVKYIIWQTMCRDRQYAGSTFSPFSEMQEKLGPMILDILVKIFDEAPVATPMRTAIQRGLRTDDYMGVRKTAYWLSIRCPLLADPGMELEVQEDIDHLETYFMEEDINVPNPGEFADYVTRAEAAWRQEMGPLGIPAAEMVAQMARDYGYQKTAKNLDSFKKATAETFFVNRTDRDFIYADDNAGVDYKIRKDSMMKGTKFHGMTMISSKLVKYGDAWNVNGICIPSYETADRPKTMSMLPGHPAMIKQIEKMIEENDGRQVLYCRDKDAVEKILGVEMQDHPMLSDIKENAVVLLSREKGFNILPNLAGAFTDPENPFYDKEKAEQLSLGVLLMCSIPDDIARHIVNRSLLADAAIYTSQNKQLGHELVQKNLEFLFGFYRSY